MGNFTIARRFTVADVEAKLTPKCDMNSFDKFILLSAKQWRGINPFSLYFGEDESAGDISNLINILKQCPSGLSFMVRKGFIAKPSDIFKVGDVIQVFDSSWSMSLTPTGFEHITKWANCQTVQVISVGNFAGMTFRKDGKIIADNDLCINDNGIIRFTSSKYAILA